jgi:hypothetical protein
MRQEYSFEPRRREKVVVGNRYQRTDEEKDD